MKQNGNQRLAPPPKRGACSEAFEPHGPEIRAESRASVLCEGIGSRLLLVKAGPLSLGGLTLLQVFAPW